MSNRITLDDLRHMTVEQASLLPVEELSMLNDDIKTLENRAKTAKAFLNMAVQAKFPDAAKMGTSRYPSESVDVVLSTDKKIEWDNIALADIEMTNDQFGKPLWTYMQIKRTVPEAVYKQMDEHTKGLFGPARTIKPGTTAIKFEMKKEAA